MKEHLNDSYGFTAQTFYECILCQSISKVNNTGQSSDSHGGRAVCDDVSRHLIPIIHDHIIMILA
jgi:hypothetical protein